jgi:integrase
VLSLDIEDLDLPGKHAKVTAKGGVMCWVRWQSGTARLAPRLIGGRISRPLFLARRRPAAACTPASADICPHTGRARLSYQRAEYLFKQATSGRTLHQLRHSRLTHLRGRLVRPHADGPVRPREPAHPRHLRQPSAEAVAAALARQDSGRRRR